MISYILILLLLPTIIFSILFSLLPLSHNSPILIKLATFRLLCVFFYRHLACENLYYYEDMRERASSLYLTNVEEIQKMMRFVKALQLATCRSAQERVTKYDSTATVFGWDLNNAWAHSEVKYTLTVVKAEIPMSHALYSKIRSNIRPTARNSALPLRQRLRQIARRRRF